MEGRQAAGERATREDPEADSLVALARRAAAGDGSATSTLLRVVAPRLVSFVRAVLGAGHPDQDDAVQHALIGFVQALPAFRGDCDPVGYGRIIAVRAALAARKRAHLERARRDGLTEPQSNVAPSPGEEAAARRRKEVMRDLLAELPEEQGEAFAMRVVLGCSLEEIAARSAAPVNTIRSRLRLAKERLRARIEADPALHDLVGEP